MKTIYNLRIRKAMYIIISGVLSMTMFCVNALTDTDVKHANAAQNQKVVDNNVGGTATQNAIFSTYYFLPSGSATAIENFCVELGQASNPEEVLSPNLSMANERALERGGYFDGYFDTTGVNATDINNAKIAFNVANIINTLGWFYYQYTEQVSPNILTRMSQDYGVIPSGLSNVWDAYARGSSFAITAGIMSAISHLVFDRSGSYFEAERGFTIAKLQELRGFHYLIAGVKMMNEEVGTASSFTAYRLADGSRVIIRPLIGTISGSIRINGTSANEICSVESSYLNCPETVLINGSVTVSNLASNGWTFGVNVSPSWQDSLKLLDIVPLGSADEVITVAPKPQISVSSQIRTAPYGSQIYQTGSIIDDVTWQVNGDMLCDSSDPLSLPGSCATYYQSGLYNDLHRLNLPGGADLGVVQTLSYPVPLNQAMGNAKNGTYSYSFSAPGEGFYVAGLRISYAGSNVTTPLTDPAETVATYKRDLTFVTQASNFEFETGVDVVDTITITGRGTIPVTTAPYGGIFPGTLSQFRGYVVGPLTQRPTPNASNVMPQVNCIKYGGALTPANACSDYSKNFPIGDGTQVWDNIGINVEANGWYVFVYHFAGDDYSPEYWSNAADGDETFVVHPRQDVTPHPVDMWSKATTHQSVNGLIQDTVYITGDVRPNSYLTFEAYEAVNPNEPAVCNVAELLYDGRNTKIPVSPKGGQYYSPWISSPQVGNVYWIATLRNEDGSVYVDERENGDFVAWRGICGEAEETSKITWGAGLDSNAVKLAYDGDFIRDIAIVSPDNGYIPDGVTITFDAYKDDSYSFHESIENRVYSETFALYSGGNFSSNPITANYGVYYWVVTIKDIWGNIVAKGDYGLASETTKVLKVTSSTKPYTQFGTTNLDEYTIVGDFDTGNVLIPVIVNSGKQVVWTGQEITLTKGVSKYLSAPALLNKIDQYYFSYFLFDKTPYATDIENAKAILTNEMFGTSDADNYANFFDQNYTSGTATLPNSLPHLIHIGATHEANEEFSVVDTSSLATSEVYVGQGFEDAVVLSGQFPNEACIMWELWYLRDTNPDPWDRLNEDVDLNLDPTYYDKLVKRTSCKPLAGASVILSDEVTFLVPGQYYWVEHIYASNADYLNKTEPIASGVKRDVAETTRVKSLTGTASTYSSTPEYVYVNNEFADTVKISGIIPSGGWVIWNLYKQSDTSVDPLDDELILINKRKTSTFDSVYLDDECQYLEDEEDICTIVSPTYTTLEAGTYYWVEAIYSPLQDEPVAVGTPRLPNETTEVKYLLGTTSSETQNQVYVNEPFWDVANLDAEIYPEGSYVVWDLYLQDKTSDDVRDDTKLSVDKFALNTYKPLNLDKCTITQNAKMQCTSPKFATTQVGTYYWVETWYSPHQEIPIATGKPRLESESVKVVPLNDTISLWSSATEKVRINEQFYDTMWATGRIPVDATIQFKIYKKNLASAEDPSDDELVYTTGEFNINSATIVEPGVLTQNGQAYMGRTISFKSPNLAFALTGQYYWVEQINSPYQDQPIVVGEPRRLSETTVVEAVGNKMVRIGKAQATAQRRTGTLGATGVDPIRIISVAGIGFAAIFTSSKLLNRFTKPNKRKLKIRLV